MPVHYCTCQVDDGAEVKLYHDNAMEYFEIASDLVTNAEHVVRCDRNNEASWGATTMSALC